MDLSPTESSSSSEEGSPVADPVGPAAGAAIAVAVAEHARASVIAAPAGDVAKDREDADKMKSYD